MEVGSSSLPGTTDSRKAMCPRRKSGGLHIARTLVEIGGLAQLARAPALQAGGQRFESVILHDPVRRMVHFALCIMNYALEEIFDILTQDKNCRKEVSKFHI